MITNKDIRVENGNIVINGDKYPLASQAEIDAVKDDIDDLGDTIGDITQTGITGATVAAQLATVAGQISDLHFAVFEHEFTDVDITNAWGSLYESTETLSFDISSLGLQSAPKIAIVSFKSTGAAVISTAATSTATAINFRVVRPSTATDLPIVATALVIY
jgi:hypothetical protein